MNVYLSGLIGSGKTTLGERYRAADLTHRTDAGRSVEEEVEDLARLLRERRP